MNGKKMIFFGGIIAFIILGAYFLIGTFRNFTNRQFGHVHREMGQRGGFGDHGFVYAPHYEVGFPWLTILFMMMAIIIIGVLLMKKSYRKQDNSSMEQFIASTLVNSHQPIMNQNEMILDEWEKNLQSKKENS